MAEPVAGGSRAVVALRSDRSSSVIGQEVPNTAPAGNVVIFLADDLGWSDVGFRGGLCR